jgi:hypothetical protein
VGDLVEINLLATGIASRHPLQVSSLDEPLHLRRKSMQAPASAAGRLRKAAENIVFPFGWTLLIVKHPRSFRSQWPALKGSYSKLVIRSPKLDL